MQKRQRNVTKKARCTCKVVVLLIKPIVILTFSLPSCRWILNFLMKTRLSELQAEEDEYQSITMTVFPRLDFSGTFAFACNELRQSIFDLES